MRARLNPLAAMVACTSGLSVQSDSCLHGFDALIFSTLVDASRAGRKSRYDKGCTCSGMLSRTEKRCGLKWVACRSNMILRALNHWHDANRHADRTRESVRNTESVTGGSAGLSTSACGASSQGSSSSHASEVASAVSASTGATLHISTYVFRRSRRSRMTARIAQRRASAGSWLKYDLRASRGIEASSE